MIRSPLGLRINPSPHGTIRDQIREAARIGAKGVVLDAIGELAPDRLGDTGRRELRHLLRSVELNLIALHLPTRRTFDTEEQLDERLARAERAFAMGFELGSGLMLARVGAVPPETDATRQEIFRHALRELGRRAEHRGVRLAIETGTEPGNVLRGVLDRLNEPGLAASIDPGTSLQHGNDPVIAIRELGPWVVHAYASDATGPSRRTLMTNPRGVNFPAGALDWEEYLGSLEEINYQGFLTIWPDPSADQAAVFQTLKASLDRF